MRVDESMLLLVPLCAVAIGLGLLDALWRRIVRVSGSRFGEAL